jgi:hypothetical protein
MIALKLTTEADLKISPEVFLQKLTTCSANLDTLLKDLHCTPEEIAETLLDPKTINTVRLKAHLATLQIKLLAIQYLPHAFAKLFQLSQESEKPEVARRASTTIINLAGIPTDTKAQPPTLTLDKQEELEESQHTPEEEEEIEPMEPEHSKRLMRLVCLAQNLEEQNLDLNALHHADFPALVQTLHDFLATHPYTPKPQ